MTEEVQTEIVEEVQQEAQVEPKQLVFTLTIDEANVVVNALGELPAKVSMGVIQKLQAQAAPQL